MKTNPRFRLSPPLLSVLLLTLTRLSPGQAQGPANPAGHWEGDIALPTTKLAILVDLEQTGGTWTGTIDIPVQGLRGFKLSAVIVDDTAVRFALPGVPGDPLFAGTMEPKGTAISGDFTQSGLKFSFNLTRKERPQAIEGETPAKGVPGRGLAGFWQGSLKASPVVGLRLVLEIASTSGGRLEGVMISLDQSAARIPLTATDDAGKVHVSVAQVGGSFDGAFNADGSELVGEWQQAGQKMPLIFKRLAHATKLNRPQEPKKPYPYVEEDVVVENKNASVKLAGTLTLPHGTGPHPVVVLITGSGPQDRDETVMGHRPFLVLADHLTRQGIAVLRYDDRGIGKSSGNFAEAAHTDFVEDALAAVAWLKARKEIDPGRIGLIGHSEGGIVAPMAAIEQPGNIAFIVLLAGVGVPMHELLVRQGIDLGRVMGQSEEHIAMGAATQRQLFPLLMKAADTAAAEKLVRETTARQLAGLTPEHRNALGMTETAIENGVKIASSKWFRTLLAYDPRPVLRQVKCPVLALSGEKDLQVAARENLAGIRDALVAGGNQQVKTIEFPGLNHLFQSCTTGAVSEYGQIEETFSPTALQAVSDWIRECTGF